MENDIRLTEIDKKEVLRYLGYKNQSMTSYIEKLIDECIKETLNLVKPRYVIQYGNLEFLDNNIRVKDTNLILEGNDIKKLLKNSKKAAFMAVTIGYEIENKIKLYEKTELTRALILDSCATTAVEKICDILEERIKNEALKENLDITFRYSPGYGDLTLDVQGMFLAVLNAQKRIGLTVSEKNILIPRKSVTAIIGFTNKKQLISDNKCKNCKNYKTCTFRKEGENKCSL
ncbi:vitamin B12 dependent-methionine synthase activation domain-containing protein [Clostridium sp. BJN0001]|uniref:vitamin B12 dependent-methionine synthase activation domain-containing protein n=1 Tax=Clostridium sp. BJN0001 TaxID=2930219 RepID=UPI001FD2FD5B|nr:vitamin B12 dependent-methionine synthase activation domain-containing protein [Clostridium sp. BJN0001]